ncbi:MAG: TolC family protein [Bacteroidales bacterium]|nr:TolC family protein [Bacteroidales bacterium]
MKATYQISIITLALSALSLNTVSQEPSTPVATESAPSMVSTAPTAAHLLTLEQLKDSALHNSFAMRKGQLEIDAAREQRREAFTNYFPNVSATGVTFRANREMTKMDINPQEFISPELGQTLAQMFPPEALAALSSPMSMAMLNKGTIGSIMAVQPIFAGGQIVIGNQLARLAEEASELQLQLTAHEVEAEVEKYFWQWVSMNEKERTLNAVTEMLANIEKDVTVAVKAGVALRNDLLQVQLQQNDIESQRLKLNNGRTLVRLLLAQSCGLKDNNISLNYQPTEEKQLQLLNHDEALLGTVEYQLLGKNVEATRLQRRMEVGKRMPSLAVGAGYNYHNLLENDRHFGMVFATVSVPITDWWGGTHAIRRKKIAERQAKEELTHNAEMLKIGMQKAWNDVEEARSQIALAKRSEEQATENLRVHRDTYKAGTSTMSDLLEAQLLYQQARDKHTDAFINLQNAQLAYRQATEN